MNCVRQEVDVFQRLNRARWEAVKRRGHVAADDAFLSVKPHYRLHVMETEDGPDGVRWWIECGSQQGLRVNSSSAAIQMAIHL